MTNPRVRAVTAKCPRCGATEQQVCIGSNKGQSVRGVDCGECGQWSVIGPAPQATVERGLLDDALTNATRLDIAGLNRLIGHLNAAFEREEQKRYGDAVEFATYMEESGNFSKEDWENLERHWEARLGRSTGAPRSSVNERMSRAHKPTRRAISPHSWRDYV